MQMKLVDLYHMPGLNFRTSLLDFFLSRIFTLFNVVVQLVAMDFIFDNIFTSERLNVLWYLSKSQEYRNDSLAMILPHLVKVCTLNYYYIKYHYTISITY